MSVSRNVVILTVRELEDIKDAAFARGVARGKFEAANTSQQVARNCANWKNGHCDTCGAQTHLFEVHGDFACPHFLSPGAL
jgi:hypothetical protein